MTSSSTDASTAATDITSTIECAENDAAARHAAADLEPIADAAPATTDPAAGISEGVPPQVSAHAKAFLQMLGRDQFEFRCFLDDKAAKKNGAQQLKGTFEEHKQMLRRLNDAGYGIFVQVNESNGQGNGAANIVKACCYFVDLDGAPRENIDRLGIVPTMTIETSPGKWHAFWRVSNIPLGHFKETQKRLIVLCASDPAVCDLPRVMRLPGFLHQKNPSAPFLTRPVGESSATYTNDEFMAALAAAEGKLGHGPNPAPAGSTPKNGRASKKSAEPDLKRAEQALRFLITTGGLTVDGYVEWRNVGFALQHDFGEDGWELFHQLSQEDPSYADEATCRKFWDTIGEPSEGRPITMASFFKRARDAGWDWDGSDDGDSGGGRGSRADGAATGRATRRTGRDLARQPDQGRPAPPTGSALRCPRSPPAPRPPSPPLCAPAVCGSPQRGR